MLNASWPTLLALLLTTNLSGPLFGVVLGSLQVLSRPAGFLRCPPARHVPHRAHKGRPPTTHSRYARRSVAGAALPRLTGGACARPRRRL